MSNTSQLPRLAVVNYVSGADHEQLMQRLEASGYKVIELPGEDVHDEASFMRAATEHLLGGYDALNWSRFEDSLGQLEWSHSERPVALVWTEVDRMLEGGLSDLVTALDIFTGFSRHRYKSDKIFVTFLLGEGPNFPSLESQLAAE